jgi:hypothetical protein
MVLIILPLKDTRFFPPFQIRIDRPLVAHSSTSVTVANASNWEEDQ